MKWLLTVAFSLLLTAVNAQSYSFLAQYDNTSTFYQPSSNNFSNSNNISLLVGPKVNFKYKQQSNIGILTGNYFLKNKKHLFSFIYFNDLHNTPYLTSNQNLFQINYRNTINLKNKGKLHFAFAPYFLFDHIKIKDYNFPSSASLDPIHSANKIAFPNKILNSGFQGNSGFSYQYENFELGFSLINISNIKDVKNSTDRYYSIFINHKIETKGNFYLIPSMTLLKENDKFSYPVKFDDVLFSLEVGTNKFRIQTSSLSLYSIAINLNYFISKKWEIKFSGNHLGKLSNRYEYLFGFNYNLSNKN